MSWQTGQWPPDTCQEGGQQGTPPNHGRPQHTELSTWGRPEKKLSFFCKIGRTAGAIGLFQISDRPEESTGGGFAAGLPLKSGESHPAAPYYHTDQVLLTTNYYC